MTMAQVEIYTTRSCPYCHSAKTLLRRKGIAYTGIDVTGDPAGRGKMVERAQAAIGCRRSSSARPCRRIRRTPRARSRGKARPVARSRRHPADGGRRTSCMSTSQASTFTLASCMRSGLVPAANLDAAVKLIGEAKAAGADYVQTPEMSNIMDFRRERLFAAITSEEQDASLAGLRELARKLAIHLHVGSLALKISPERAVNRSFVIDPQGEILS